MGFYGNITNTSKTNFVFDKIYTNRKAMDENITKDGIFIGRYVLVEYGQITNDSFIRAYGPDTNGYYHTSDNEEEVTRILYTSNKNKVEGRHITNGIIIYTITKNNNKDIYNYYECKGGTEDGLPDFANNPGLNPNNDPYFFNFNQDKQKYDTSRGYDGTVWVKTSINNEIKYVNIAELNSVVPSFEMVADAPTMSPILPHFDTASNNVYYKLHWQPAWGMRVAKADNPERSDYKTAWSQEYYKKETGEAYTKWYNPETGEWDSDSPCEIVADIYFNKAAFDSQVGKDTINGVVKDTNNYIGITADGLSGNKYNLHDGTSNTKQQVDTQQIHINLPAIGNMMSEAWDIIHGEKRDNTRTDEDGGSLQGRLDSFMAFYDNQIPVKNENGTIVGSKINGAQPYDNDWEEKPIEVLYDNTEPGFERDDAWIKTEINTNGLKTGDKGGSNDQVDNSGISIHHTFHSTKDTKATLDKNSGTQTLTHIDNTTVDENKKDKIPVLNKSDKETGKEDTIKLYTPYVDAKGHVIGKNIETITLPYGYKTIKVTNTEDTVVSEANAEIKTNGQSADNTQDILTLSASNRWIKLDNNSEDQIKIGHKHSDFVTGTEANTYYGLTQNEDHTKSINTKGDLDNDNTFEVPCLKFDEAGHILEARTHTVTLPELFTKVNIGAANTTTGVANGQTTTTHTADSLEADTMTDEFTIQPGNKWIQMTADKDNDAFSVQHYVKLFEETTPTAINYNNANTKQFSIQAIDWDEAGHLTSSAKTTYTLPDGFKIIKIANSGSSTTDFSTASNANLVAETLTDTATIDTGNRWLTLVADANDDKVTLSHAAAGTTFTSKNLQTDNNTSPNFGDSFNVLTAGIDEAGHVKDLNHYSITLPTSKLETGTTDASTASVVTGITLTDTNKAEGKFIKSTANVGTLALTGYTLGTDAGALVSSDTINGAMSKLQKQINNEVAAREKAIKDLDVTTIITGTDKVFNSISEADGKIDASTQIVSNLTLSNYSIASSYTGIQNGNTLNTAFGQLEKGLAEEKARAQEEEEKLSDRITAIIDGVTEEELNTLKELSDALNDEADFATIVIEELTNIKNNYILKSDVETNYVLKSDYANLLDKVAALEAVVFPPEEPSIVQ